MRRRLTTALLSLVLVSSFIAYLPLTYAATLTVGLPGSGAQYTSINSAVSAASPGDVVQVWPGTYTESVSVSKSIALVSRDGPSVTIISSTTSAACVAVSANSVTISGFTVQGGWAGIQLESSSYSTINNNIGIDNGIIAPGHGFVIEGGGQNIITNNVAEDSYANGFYFHLTNANYIYNNQVVKKNPTDTYSTRTQHGFGFSSSNGNLIVGNLADSAYFDGFIFVLSSSNNVIVGNIAQNNHVDGIVLTDASQSNYIAKNTIRSNTYTGLWLNGESDFNWITGNSIQGQGEVGIAVYTSSWNTIEYNRVFSNVQAGIYLWNDPSHLYSTAGSPRYNTVQWNAVYQNQYYGIKLDGASYTRIVGNFVQGQTNYSNDCAVYITNANNNEVFENTLIGYHAINFYMLTGSGNVLYHNNVFGSVSNYDYQGATWDLGSVIGGNYWQSYSGFIGSSAQDHYRFASENGWQQPNVSITSPSGGESWAAGTAKAVRWTARDAVYVNLYQNTGSAWSPIATNLPNTGYYLWSSSSPTASEAIRIDGTDSAGAVTSTASTSSFSIASNAVSLLYPVGGDKLTASSTTTLRWTSSASVAKVNLAYNCGSGWQTIVNSLTNTGSYNWAVPAASAPACFLQVQGLNSGNNQVGSDQNDIPFSITSSSSSMAVISPTAGEVLPIGSAYLVQWLSSGSSYVDVYYNTGSGFSLLSTVQDTGRYYWTVPNTPSSSVRVRIDGKAASGSVVATANSGVFTIGSGPSYSATFAESGIPTGTSWGVTVAGSHYSTSSATSISVTGLTGTVSYSYDSPVSGPGGSYVCTSTCSGSVSGSATITATFTQFDFRLYNSGSTSNLGGLTIAHGRSGSITITGALVYGAGQTVTLTCTQANGSPLPSGISCGSSSGTPPFTTSLTITVSSSVTPRYYTIRVNGTADGLTRITIFTLRVT